MQHLSHQPTQKKSHQCQTSKKRLGNKTSRDSGRKRGWLHCIAGQETSFAYLIFKWVITSIWDKVECLRGPLLWCCWWWWRWLGCDCKLLNDDRLGIVGGGLMVRFPCRLPLNLRGDAALVPVPLITLTPPPPPPWLKCTPFWCCCCWFSLSHSSDCWLVRVEIGVFCWRCCCCSWLVCFLLKCPERIHHEPKTKGPFN